MPEQQVLTLAELPQNSKKTVTLGDLKVLLVRTDDVAGSPRIFALEAECPHAKAPLEKGAVCNGRLVCPWHTGTFALDTGALLEPPPLRALERYPVRLEKDAIHVDSTPLPAEKPPTVGEGKHLVFAGGGTATAAALAYLRDQHFAGQITVIEPLAEEPIDRTQLTKMSLAGKKPLESLPIFSPENEKSSGSLGALQIERVGAAVTKLDQSRRSLALNDGKNVEYDALLLATGSKPKDLPADGAHGSNVFTIRHTGDLRRMEPLLKAGARVALIGDSFIAFEAASALTQRGLHATVIANSRQPFAKKFGEQVAAALLKLHREHGVKLHTETEVAAISPVGVTLKSGGEIPADLVIVAIGVEPVTDIAPSFPKGKKGGFEVGPDLRLAPNVWCAGDIASVEGLRIEHWRLAEQHGRTAAEGMLAYVTGNAQGAASPFAGVPFFWTFHFGKRFGYAGHADSWDRIHVEGNPDSLEFLAFYLQGERVAAVLGCGRDTALASLMEPLRKPLTLAEARTYINAAS